MQYPLRNIPVHLSVPTGSNVASQKAERVREVRSCASHQVHKATHKLWVRTTRLYGLVVVVEAKEAVEAVEVSEVLATVGVVAGVGAL
ncbi:unnamed protein product [Closterium sp. NIES-54]